ncbi:MAG: hypothetical protein JXR76_01845 [Deltaproteobacteria bacterium]|nr:hypothetical protein [Deltaproteobacteria bacterium]
MYSPKRDTSSRAMDGRVAHLLRVDGVKKQDVIEISGCADAGLVAGTETTTLFGPYCATTSQIRGTETSARLAQSGQIGHLIF